MFVAISSSPPLLLSSSRRILAPRRLHGANSFTRKKEKSRTWRPDTDSYIRYLGPGRPAYLAEP
eukprot:766077-Hanusia_phi.AAC.2